MNREQETYLSQKKIVLDILRTGRPIDKIKAERMVPRIGNLYAVLGDIRDLGHLIVAKTEGTENGLTEYYLASAISSPPVQVADALDDTDTALLVEPEPITATLETEPEQPPVELRHHHIANPGDTSQILAAFKKYCEQQPNPWKKVPITPEWAKLIILLNRDIKDGEGHILRRNRKVSPTKLNEICKHFKENKDNPELLYTTDGVGFDNKYGMMVNGQTRAMAAARTGVTFYADVGFDFPPEVFDLIDRPESSRKPGDQAYMMGIDAYPKLTAAVWSTLYRKYHGISEGTPLRASAIREASKLFPDLPKSVEVAQGMKISGSKAVYGAMHYLMSKINRLATDKFFRDLSTGAGLDENDPVLVARNRIQVAYATKKNEFRGGSGQKRFRSLLALAFRDRLRNKSVGKYILEGRDEWPTAPVKKSTKTTTGGDK